MQHRVILRIFCLAVFVIICFAQCYSILKSFLSYPRIINIYDESPSLITILPGLTICNNNRVSLRKLVNKNKTLKRLFGERFPGYLMDNGQIRPLVDSAKFNSFRDEVSKIYERNNNYYYQQTKNLTLNEWFDHRPDMDPFIEWFGCARTWKDSIDCGNLTRIESMSNRKCSTLLHRGAMLYDAYNKPELFNTTIEKSSALNYFDAKEVIKIVLNFEPEDYGDLKRQIGARITFHDSSIVASLGDLDYFVTRGYKYDFSIDRKDIRHTGPPYDSCLHYDSFNLDKYKEQIEPRAPLSVTTCFQNCVVRNMIHHLNCWPPTMPYFRNDSLDPELKLRTCPWFEKSYRASVFTELMRLDNVRQRLEMHSANQSGATADQQSIPSSGSGNDSTPRMYNRDKIRKYRKVLRFCWSRCLLPCRLATYTVTVTRSAWPSDVKILFDETGKNKLRRHCCALIAVKFTHFHYNIHEYQFKYDVTNTVGDLGGLLAFWLGLSIVSIYHAIQKLLSFCSKRSTLNRIHHWRL